MGNQNAKTKAKTHFTEAELKALEASFRGAAGGHTDRLMKEKFEESWSAHIDAHLVARTANFLYSSGSAASPQCLKIITIQRYSEPFYIVERGSIEEKVNFLAASMEQTPTNQFAVKELENYVASVLKSYVEMHTNELATNHRFRVWQEWGYQSTERSILGFAKGLTRSLAKVPQDDHHFYVDQLEKWLQTNPIFLKVWREVFTYVYNKLTGKTHNVLGSGSNTENGHIMMPLIEGLAAGTNYTPVLDLPHVIFINSNLPNEMQHKWRFLFSSKIMGESFSTMLGKMQKRGPTLLIVEDEDRYIFGAYAPESWALRPTFVGDNSSMLFTLSPAMRVFGSTGYNNHYQYLNLNQQTMPNGLGMGGQFNYWGLWIDCEYGLGQSCESCTTYSDYVQLSKRKEFRIRNLEVWGIGDEPKPSDDSDDECVGGSSKPKSILDKNLEDRVMLELSGQKMHSDGLREPEMDL